MTKKIICLIKGHNYYTITIYDPYIIKFKRCHRCSKELKVIE